MVYKKKFYYKGVEVNALGIPVFLLGNKKRIKKDNRKISFYNTSFSSPFEKSSPRDLIIMYEIGRAHV